MNFFYFERNGRKPGGKRVGRREWFYGSSVFVGMESTDGLSSGTKILFRTEWFNLLRYTMLI